MFECFCMICPDRDLEKIWKLVSKPIATLNVVFTHVGISSNPLHVLNGKLILKYCFMEIPLETTKLSVAETVLSMERKCIAHAASMPCRI